MFFDCVNSADTERYLYEMRTLLAVLLMTPLVACGSSDTGGATSPAGGTSARQLAAQLDCTGDDGTASNKVSCEFQDSFLGITVYKSKDAYKSDVDSATGFGASILVNDDELWMIDAPDAATLEAAQAIVGGDIK